MRYRKHTVEFEYDFSKSAKNQEKHGIDFQEAQALWQDGDRIQIPARSDDEPRSAIFAQLGEKVWVVFFTIREEKIRIISVRRARPNEIELYEGRGT